MDALKKVIRVLIVEIDSTCSSVRQVAAGECGAALADAGLQVFFAYANSDGDQIFAGGKSEVGCLRTKYRAYTTDSRGPRSCSQAVSRPNNIPTAPHLNDSFIPRCVTAATTTSHCLLNKFRKPTDVSCRTVRKCSTTIMHQEADWWA
jgi:hypothetical protein